MGGGSSGFSGGFTERMAKGEVEAAMRHFVDYWSSAGTWEAMEEGTRAHMWRAAQKIMQEFNAASADPLVDALRDVAFPVRLIGWRYESIAGPAHRRTDRRAPAQRKPAGDCWCEPPVCHRRASSRAERVAAGDVGAVTHLPFVPAKAGTQRNSQEIRARGSGLPLARE